MDGLTTGKRIQKIRTSRGMSIAMLAALVDMSSQGIFKLESDGSNEPSYLNGLRIAKALGVSPWELAGEPGPRPIPAVEIPGTVAEHDARLELVEEHVAPADATAQRLATIEATLMQLTSTAFPRYPGLVSTLPSPGRIEQVEDLAKGMAERAASLADLVAEIGGRLRALEATAHQHGKRSASGPTGRS